MPVFFTFSAEPFSGDASVALMGQGQYKLPSPLALECSLGLRV